MPPPSDAERPPWPRTRGARALVLLLGVLLPQVLLYGPSLVGARILLPLELLALPRFYLPASEARGVAPTHLVFTDQVLNYEFSRRFAAAEVRAGRLPLWDPYSFCGSPFAHFGKYCPFYLLYYAWPSPVALAWIQLAKAVVSAVGAYLFFRRALGAGFWAAAVGAWCYPLTGFSILWQGYPITLVTAFLPWVLLATDTIMRRPLGWGVPGLALATSLTITAGHLDIAGQVLLASGLYALWAAWDRHGWTAALARPVAAACLGWALGILLAAPYLLPLLEYARTGARVAERAHGSEERPPIGLSALPLIVLPDAYGSERPGSLVVGTETQPESASSAYAGLVATLFLAPLAWIDRRRRRAVACWLVLGLVGLAWTLDVPGLVQLFRLPGLNLMSHNRLVFVTSFAILCLAVMGLEGLAAGPGWHNAYVLAAGVPAALGVWCLVRAVRLPRGLATQLQERVAALERAPLVVVFPRGGQIESSFRLMYAAGAVFALIAVLGWALTRRSRPGMASVMGAVMLGELLWFARGINAQTDPALYYPAVPALAQLSQLPPGRVLGVDCLPANLEQTVGLRDVRGYDGIDPKAYVDLLEGVRNRRFPAPSFAVTQWYVPRQRDGRLPAVFDMLNLRYLVYRGTPPPAARPVAQSPDYWVTENRHALPRVFVPRQVEQATARDVATHLTAPGFDPAAVAYVEDREPQHDCQGRGAIAEENPTRVIIDAAMQTPGVLVLADRWDAGWVVTVNDSPAPLVRVNQVLRGVRLPAGHYRVVFSYEPASLALGWKLALGAVVVLIGWMGLVRRLA